MLKNGKSLSYTSTLYIEPDNTISRTTESIAPCYTPPAIDETKGRANMEADIPFAPYDNARPYDSFKGKGEVAYFFRKKENGVPVDLCYASISNLKRPIIIVDGFDPGDTRGISDIYEKRLSYGNISNPNNLGEELRDLGYDVVILNFPRHEVARINIPLVGSVPIFQDHGSDYIERNAMTLVKLIQQTNAQLQANGSNEQLIIVGPSMGGLISRYALAYMEKNNIPHNTRLWVSFDSPHNGATIPMGVQMFLHHNATIQNSADAQNTLQNKLNTPAAKQMLLQHYSGYNGDINNPSILFRSLFHNNLTNNGLYLSEGFPTRSIRLSLVNGSKSGLLQGNSGQLACYFWIGVNIFNIGEIRPFESKIFTSGSYGNTTLAFHQKINAPFNIGGNNATYNYYSTSPNNTIGFDIAPGGHYDAFRSTYDEFPGSIGSDSVHKEIYLPTHCFIPTKSALAYKGSNQDLAEVLNNRNLTCTGEIPFDDYYAPDTNEEHVELNSANVAWLLGHLSPTSNPVRIVCKNPQVFTLTKCPANTQGVEVKVPFILSKGVYSNGSVTISAKASGNAYVEFWKGNTRLQRYEVRAIVVNNEDITGPASVCGTPATFSLGNVPSDIAVTWETSPNVSPSSGTGTIATVSSIGTGEAWIEFTLQPCGQKVRKYFNSLSRIEGIQGNNAICSTGSNIYEIEDFVGATYTWTSSANITLTSLAPNRVSATGTAPGDGWIRVDVSVSSSCHTESRWFRKKVWVGLPNAPVVTQPAGATPIAPDTYEFTFYQSPWATTETIRLRSLGAERLVYTRSPNPPSNGPSDLPSDWAVLTSISPINGVGDILVNPNRMEVGTTTYTVMGQNNCNTPFATTAPQTTVIIHIRPISDLQRVAVYPNPTGENLHLQAENLGTIKFTLYNKFNQKVAEGEFEKRQILSLKDLPQDVYFLHLHYPDGNVERKQIVVSR